MQGIDVWNKWREKNQDVKINIKKQIEKVVQASDAMGTVGVKW